MKKIIFGWLLFISTIALGFEGEDISSRVDYFGTLELQMKITNFMAKNFSQYKLVAGPFILRSAKETKFIGFLYKDSNCYMATYRNKDCPKNLKQVECRWVTLQTKSANLRAGHLEKLQKLSLTKF